MSIYWTAFQNYTGVEAVNREAKIIRETKETKNEVSINLDGAGNYEGNTGIGFFDHMLCLLAKHGLMDIYVKAEGDLEVDCHHTVEDIGIVLGCCIKDACKDKTGIGRYGNSFVPMDEALAAVTVDISGRPHLVFEGGFTTDRVGDFETEMVEEFFRAISVNACITLHARVLYGRNNHHMIEALFKALGRALREAWSIDERVSGVMSTKGCL